MRVPPQSSSNFRRLIPAIVVLLVLGWIVNALRNVGHNEGYVPTQPTPFSHKIHAGVNNIPCMYCHSGVEKSRHALIPSMNVCMNCHTVVKPDSPHIKALKELHAKGETFQWIRVHDLPDHVNFNHKRHVAKGVACETCHGDVKKMDVVRQEKSLTMGWCLECHRGQTAPAHLIKASAGLDPRRHYDETSIPRNGVAPTSCYTCHQ